MKTPSVHRSCQLLREGVAVILWDKWNRIARGWLSLCSAPFRLKEKKKKFSAYTCKPTEWHVNTSYIIICKRQFQLCATIVIQQKYRLKTSLGRVSVISLERNPEGWNTMHSELSRWSSASRGGRWSGSGIWSTMPLECHPSEVLRAFPTGTRSPGDDTGHSGDTLSPGWLPIMTRDPLGRAGPKWLGRGKSRLPC